MSLAPTSNLLSSGDPLSDGIRFPLTRGCKKVTLGFSNHIFEPPALVLNLCAWASLGHPATRGKAANAVHSAVYFFVFGLPS